MIFYFSGTGNSLYAAKKIAQEQDLQLASIAEELLKENNDFIYECKEDEPVGFVYPIYAWGPPELVIDFISKMTLSGGKPYLFALSTCGDEEGMSTELILKQALAEKELALDSAFTIRMPNNYIIGFDPDPKTLEEIKLSDAERALLRINSVISHRDRDVFDLLPGSSPKLKSKLIHPLFVRFASATKKFSATDACTACGLCEEICPVKAIKVDGKPKWVKKKCTQCLACINRCPVAAIQHGPKTEARGRYVHPDLK